MSRSRRSRVEAAANAGPAASEGVAGRLHSAVHWFAAWVRACARTARLAIGIPDYDGYVAHLANRHPGCQPMSRESFFRERMQARYGRGRSRCC
jgi:uncharacterized short protein YbdD (DUF466 family)